ncbi:hypothetical protein JXL19_07730, partial [bacterium]|nr:hypothetical protein [bacterium]
MNNMRNRNPFEVLSLDIIVLVFLCILALVFPSARVTFAKTLEVGPPGSGYKYSDIGLAVYYAEDGDEVLV